MTAPWQVEAREEMLALCRAAYPDGLTSHPTQFLDTRTGSSLETGLIGFAKLPEATETLGPWTLSRRVWATPLGYQWAEARNVYPPPGEVPSVLVRSSALDYRFLPVELVDVVRVLRNSARNAVDARALSLASRASLRDVRLVLDGHGFEAALHLLDALGIQSSLGRREGRGHEPASSFDWCVP